MFYANLGFILLIGQLVNGDIYMHNPRGSNNRLDEQGRERNNGNRVFDSQNNDRGGYNVGSLYYYAGSILPIEWTSQHSCGGPNNHCELIVQYMCDENLRDGATTTTIPDNPALCENYLCNTDLRYGMHEDFQYYMDCKMRLRNDNLFLADQQLKGNTARFTRQNPQGTRRGYECPEERDYYPYWHPSPWRDIAIMTNNVSRCSYYQEESENVKSRYYCYLPYTLKVQNQRNLRIPNNKEDCEAFVYPANDANGTRGVWTESPSHGIDPPMCQEAEFSRDNHLGNGPSGYPNLFNWTIPEDAIAEKCAVRIRYNISTAEFDGWDGSTNATLNEVQNNEGSLLDLSSKYGLSDLEEARDRGYVLENNPQTDIFDNDKLVLQLAINTAQFGRTFQDRSHAMAMRSPPDELVNSRVFNVNVRGKRGNIVQVYPAVEYDFVPNTLMASVGDYVHIQWTGSNTNPRNNDGQGLAGTDRSNMVLQADTVYDEDSGSVWEGRSKFGHWGRSYPEILDDSTLLGLTRPQREMLALVAPGQFRGEMSELDDAGTYFDLGPQKVTTAGVAHYMCTRNNNFSNRSQKGKLVVMDIPIVEAQIGSMGGEMELPQKKAMVKVEVGVLPDLMSMQMESWPSEIGNQRIVDAGESFTLGNDYASEFVVLNPQEKLTVGKESFRMEIQLNTTKAKSKNLKVYRTNSQHFATYEELDSVVEGNMAVIMTDRGGVYFVRENVQVAGAAVGGTLAAVVIIIIIVATVVYFRKKPEKLEAINKRIRHAKRSAQSSV